MNVTVTMNVHGECTMTEIGTGREWIVEAVAHLEAILIPIETGVKGDFYNDCSLFNRKQVLQIIY